MNTSVLVKFGFYVGTFASNANNDWFIDNFRINDTIYYWGVDEINQVNNFIVFPNPNTGIFTVLNEGAENQTNIKVMDVQGRVVYNEAFLFNSNERKVIDINSFNSGVQVLLIESEGKLEQHRIIVNK